MTTTTTSQEVQVGDKQIDCEVGHRDWASLPEELLKLILSNFVLIDDVKKFRAVCKAWQSNEYLKDHIGFGCQCLVRKTWDESIVTLFHPLSCQAYNMDIPELKGAFIRFSKDGWLLMSRGYHEIFFFHLFTRSKIQLANLPEVYDFNGITFTSNPTAYDCVVFGISVYVGEYVEIYTISHGVKDWSRTIFDIGPNSYPNFCPSYSNPVYHKGKFYTLAKYGELGTFDPNGNVWAVTPRQPRPKDLYENYLLDFDGDLVSVFVARTGATILIFKWDESACSWIFLDDLGEHMLFLSETTSYTKKSLRDCMKNKIYFPRFADEHILFLDKKDGCYQTFENDSWSRDLYYTEPQLECCWIEPTKEIGTKLVDWFGNSILI